MSIVDLRYARAFAAVVDETKGNPAEARAQLEDFHAALESSSDLREVLANPAVPEPQKLRLLDALAERIGMSRAARNLVAVVSAHGRLDEFGEILTAYSKLADAESHVAEAEIVTAPQAAVERGFAPRWDGRSSRELPRGRVAAGRGGGAPGVDGV